MPSIGKSQEAKTVVLIKLHPDAIKLTRNFTDHGGWLPFLNFVITITEARFETKWFRKPMNMDIITKHDSTH